ncbi:MAG: NAD(+) diphosphatase [Desulfuromonas sp.]|nr:NAD(+) diphosphatase [Desulfuromonas sp.]
MLPEYFASALHLPFNRHSLESEFEFLAPDKEPQDDGLWLILQGGSVLLETQTGDLVPTPPQPLIGQALFIGYWRGQACRVAAYSSSLPCPEGMQAHDIMADDPQLSLALLSLAALGQQMLNWHKNSQYCSRCGGQMDFIAGEWGKQCHNCNSSHYPHVHPCIIVLITRGDEVLLTRKANWVAGRYSLVAGFVEPGECLEETVVREVLEETGIAVKNIQYIGSQAWPFPSQNMMGFTAEYAGGEVVVERAELEDARWFHRADLPLLPSRRSIARFMLDHYL